MTDATTRTLLRSQPVAPTRRRGGRRVVDPLLHPTRQQLVMEVASDPGISFRALARRLGLHLGTTGHHVRVLKRHKALLEVRLGCTTCFYPLGFDTARAAVTAVLREDALRRLHDWIAQHPGANQSTIIQAMGWSHSTTQHRLARLVAVGAVSRHESGRSLHYHATAAPRVPAAPAATRVGAEV